MFDNPDATGALLIDWRNINLEFDPGGSIRCVERTLRRKSNHGI
jgi:hypothetical protein